jgi:hypothetical protein
MPDYLAFRRGETAESLFLKTPVKAEINTGLYNLKFYFIVEFRLCFQVFHPGIY